MPSPTFDQIVSEMQQATEHAMEQWQTPTRQLDPPKYLYRYFDEEEHAMRLIEDGEVWLSTLEWVRNQDNWLADDGDGSTVFHPEFYRPDSTSEHMQLVGRKIRNTGFPLEQWPGVTFSGISFENRIQDAYIYCTSLTGSEGQMESKFGRFIVRIESPLNFCAALYQGILDAGIRIARADFARVLYQERDISDLGPDPAPPGFLAPKRLAYEREVRMQFIPHERNGLQRRAIVVPAAAKLCSIY